MEEGPPPTAADTSEAAAIASNTTEGFPTAADTSEAAALAPGTTRELPAAANTDPNQSSRDATGNVGATNVTTGNRAKRQDGAGAKKEGPRPKRQRQNIAGETSKGNLKTPGPKFHIPDVIEPEVEGKDNVTELEAENVEPRSKLGRSERKNDVEEMKEMREFAWNNKAVVESLVEDGEGAIDEVMSVSPNLGKMKFSHNADAKLELAAWTERHKTGLGDQTSIGE
ncbi:hypothetical protein BDR22DRAFT_886093 [Usnea florida]